ncbi:MAG: glycosyltransferase family 39 protein [Devosia nanyangense]|uniref:Glycosyltransferase family 39 protein n=1 Tax=Devosia nanyangense TaxID=1228055 RepID=A0A933L669_9HYPH|nr:glycosyltransferase family 39 protein [Devosia nanyangense]
MDWRILRAIALGLLAIKLVLLGAIRPFMDETYYFLWGQHLALSYFDHPPLIGWTQWVAGSLFGWTVFGLRAVVALTLLGDLVLLWLFARRLAGDGWRETFWPLAVVFLASPIFFALSSVALPDHLLVLFSLATLYAVESFRQSVEAGAPRWRWLYLGALAIGLATLSKYTGALLGVALLAYLVAVPSLRRSFRSPHLCLAGFLAIALQTPVIVWNLQHRFASFGFIFGGRAALRDLSSLVGLGGFVLGAVVLLSPVLVIPIGRFLLARRDGHGFARLVFWLSTVGFLAASLVTNILIHWNVIAYLAVLPFLAPYLRSRLLLGAQIVYGALAIAVATVNYTALPVLALVGPGDQTSAWSYGWDEVAAAVVDVKATMPVDFVAATDYALASPLAFELRDPNVTSLSRRHDAYDDWFDPAAHKGQTALIVADRWRPLSTTLSARFGSVEKVKTVTITRYGRRIDVHTLYIGRDFSP